jgi:hypothetical protein
MKHKWYNEIVAWASGAEIESESYIDDDLNLGWKIDHYPDWHSNVNYRIKPHKHQAIIDAFEQGAVIEAQLITGTWCEVITPDWESNYKFRIKPQPKEPKYLYVYQNVDGNCALSIFSDKYNGQKPVGKIKLED